MVKANAKQASHGVSKGSWRATREKASSDRERGRRDKDEPTVPTKLRHWGQCDGQQSLFE